VIFLQKKIILISFISIILSVIIYFYTKTEKINIVALGDGLSLGMTPYNIKGYSYNDYLKNFYQDKRTLNKYYDFSEHKQTVKELIYEINNNKTIDIKDEKISIQHAINIANVLTICIGMDELFSTQITNIIIKEYKDDLKELLNQIKKLNNKQVIIIGLYTVNNRELTNIMKINAFLQDIALEYNFTYINLQDITFNKDYFFDSSSYYLNFKGHKAVYQEIKKHL